MSTSRSQGTHEPNHTDANGTLRQSERQQEDDSFLPVIVKRTDESLRHPDDILVKAIREGEEQLQRPPFSLGLSALAAGLILGFTAMAVAVVTTVISTFDIPGVSRVVTASVYPLGFVLCLMSGTELFTEHTATAVYPILDGRLSVTKLLRLWGIVGVGNLVGAAASACLLWAADSVIGARVGYVEIGQHLVTPTPIALLTSALLAGWLMALGAWLILATPPTISQMASIYIVTFLIGLGGLHHSIAGAVEMFAAVLMGNGEFTVGQAGRFVGLAMIGNLVGGSFFVASLNYAHIRTTRSAETQNG